VAGSEGGPGIESEYKFLLVRPPSTEQLERFGECAHITQHYLSCDDPSVSRRVRVLSRGGIEEYFYTEKSAVAPEDLADANEVADGPLHRVEDERRIPRWEFEQLLGEQDPATTTVVKRRWSHVLAGGATVDLDHLSQPLDLWVVELELPVNAGQATLSESPVDGQDPRTLLAGLVDLGADVTFDSSYSMGGIAKGTLSGRGVVGGGVNGSVDEAETGF
jgi:hypothetical protein